MYYEAVKLAGRPYVDQITNRFNAFGSDLPMNVISSMPRQFSGAQIKWITVAGRAAGRMRYGCVDLNMCLEGVPECENVTVEKLIGSYKVAMHFKDNAQIDSTKYLLFAFSKPVLWGSVPSLYTDRIPGMLSFGVRKSLSKFSVNTQSVNQGKHELGKACSALMDGCRYAHTIYGLRKIEYPTNLTEAIKTLYAMDAKEDYQPSELNRIRGVISLWGGIRT